MQEELDDLSLDAIMRRWPGTIRVFIDWRLHCIGCPIAGLHTISDAALEHGYRESDLEGALRLVIEQAISPGAPARYRRRSASGDGGP